jgi:hypothetical protein
MCIRQPAGRDFRIYRFRVAAPHHDLNTSAASDFFSGDDDAFSRHEGVRK